MQFPRHKVIFTPTFYTNKRGKRKQQFGDVDPDTKIIRINLLKDITPCRTYLHELLHLKYPEKPERLILKLEKSLWKKMSTKQRLRFYKKLFT